jgi:hypothetical protein
MPKKDLMVLLLILIAAVWLTICVLVVAACRAAATGDRADLYSPPEDAGRADAVPPARPRASGARRQPSTTRGSRAGRWSPGV